MREGGETSLALRLQTCRLFRPAIGIGGKLIAMNSLIEKPCLHRPGGARVVTPSAACRA